MRGTRVMERDFYGVVRTRDRAEPVPYRAMLHGGIVHGGQLLGETYRNTPSDYFGPTSGYGRLFAALNEQRPQPRKVGIIGLGAGVVASYGRAGDEFVFYEISPASSTSPRPSSRFCATPQRGPACSATGAFRSSARRRAATTSWASTPSPATRSPCTS
jgi:hypothetical protein